VLRREAFRFGQVEAEATPRACACSSQIGGSYRVKRAFPSIKLGPTHRSRRALTLAESWPCAALSGLFLRSSQDRRIAPGVRLLQPNRGLVPRQAVFSSVKSGPTHRSRRAFTPAESWPHSASSGLFLWSNQDRRIAPGVRLLLPNRGLVPRHAAFPSVTTISDRLGTRAPKAIRA
jgi:hypothetical protein